MGTNEESEVSRIDKINDRAGEIAIEVTQFLVGQLNLNICDLNEQEKIALMANSVSRVFAVMIISIADSLKADPQIILDNAMKQFVIPAMKLKAYN